ncbi:MAG: hypothetical protein GW886_16185 [Rhodobacterales bacterium]|nr:hypothetical protein [Rhodobacterales bacterium]
MITAESNQPGSISTPDAMEITLLINAMAEMRAEIPKTKAFPRMNALQQDLRALQQRLAVLFGATRGWTLSRSDFTPAVLARRGLFDGRGYYADPWPRDLVDHPFYYRKDRMASAVAAHLYGTFDAAKRQDIAALAELKGLRATWPEDFPSWWLPGRTTLVVYTPMTGPAR